MPMNSTPRSLNILLITFMFFLSGCVGKSQPPRFYMLSSVKDQPLHHTNKTTAENITIGIGPITVADYLEQSRIVTRMNDTIIDQAEFDHWSGSFKAILANTIAENISYLLMTDHVVVYPWRSYIPVKYSVIIDIVRFDGKLGDNVVFISRWMILSENEKKVLAMERTEIQKNMSGPEYKEYVAAQSKVLADFCHKIAQKVNDISQGT